MAQPIVDAGQDYNIFVGVVIAELAITLLLYIVLKMIHYIVWGYKDDEQSQDNKEVEDQRKWDQNSWDIYFPIIFTNHVVAIALPLIYNPSIIACVISWIHFALFIGLVVINVFVREEQPGQGAKTSASRILWLIMCLTNMMVSNHQISGYKNKCSI